MKSRMEKKKTRRIWALFIHLRPPIPPSRLSKRKRKHAVTRPGGKLSSHPPTLLPIASQSDLTRSDSPNGS